MSVLLGSVAALASEGSLLCLLEVEVPRFAVANLGSKGGTIKASVTIGEGGRPSNVEFPQTEQSFETTERSLKLLRSEVETHLRQRASFDEKCSGSSLDLVFTFRVEGSPQPMPFTIVRFRPPNQFVIVTQPSTGTVTIMEPIPAPKKAKKR